MEGGGGEKKNVPAKMTRSKPDQRRWSFCESVTAGARESVKEGRRGRERKGGEETVLNRTNR